jgi:hypothetical protein
MSLRLTLGASATGYEQSIISGGSRSSSLTNSGLGSNQTYWTIGTSVGDSTNSTVTFNLDVYAPFTTKRTMFSGWNAAFAGADAQQLVGGLHLTSASYSAFTLTASTGTFTGGVIRVYGYQK